MRQITADRRTENTRACVALATALIRWTPAVVGAVFLYLWCAGAPGL